AGSVQRARGSEGERRDRGVEVRAVVADQVVAALHAANRGFQHRAGGVFELLARLDPRLLAHHALAAHLLDLAVAVGDDPVAAHQLRRQPPQVADADGVGEYVMFALGLGFLVEETGRDLDFQRVVRGLVHADSVMAAGEGLDYRGGAMFARRMNSATDSRSARVPGSISAAAKTASSQSPDSALRRVLR